MSTNLITRFVGNHNYFFFNQRSFWNRVSSIPGFVVFWLEANTRMGRNINMNAKDPKKGERIWLNLIILVKSRTGMAIMPFVDWIFFFGVVYEFSSVRKWSMIDETMQTTHTHRQTHLPISLHGYLYRIQPRRNDWTARMPCQLDDSPMMSKSYSFFFC